MKAAAVVLGVLFVLVAIVYFAVPAESLPHFVPGFQAGSPRVHVKHGLVSLAVGLVLFGVAWFAGRSR